MKIINFHTHIYPDKIAEKAALSIGEFYGGVNMSGNGTVDGLLKEGKAAGVSEYLVHSVAVSERVVNAINDFIIDECKKHSEFHGFGTMHADYENKIDECKRIIDLGLKGIKIHPDTQKFNLDDERMYEFYDYLRQNHIPLLTHCGDYRFDYSHPKRLKKLLHDLPGLTVIGAHFGGWSICDLAYEYLADENCMLDTSSSFWMLGKNRSKEIIRMYGAERLVFGSDYPMWNTGEELEFLLSLGLSDDELELILHKNAEMILNLREDD